VDYNEFYFSKEIANSILLEGEDDFLVTSAIKKIKNAFNIEDLDISKFSGQDSVASISTSLDTIPFLSQKRLVIISEFYPKAKEIPNLKVGEDTILLICNKSKNDALKKIVSLVVDTNKSESFVKNYLNSLFKKEGKKIGENSLNLLIDYCSCDAYKCVTESKKLISYCKDKDLVEIDDITAVVTPDFEYKIYELTEYIATKKSQKAYSILQDMLNKNEPSHKLFISIYNHFRRLFYCKLNSDSYELSTILGIKEYAVKKAQSVANKFTANELKKINARFNEYDFMVKSGKMDVFNALWLGVFQITA